jgi:hypothetical protein
MFRLTARRVFMILVLVMAIFAGAQYAPAIFYSFQFNDFIRQEVKYAAAARKSTDDIGRELLDKAKEMHIPITARDIHVTRRGPAFTLDLDYSWPIDLRVYQHELKFHVSETGESFERN